MGTPRSTARNKSELHELQGAYALPIGGLLSQAGRRELGLTRAGVRR